MQIQPIIAALKKHKLATVLIALEIALACAVLCNACFLIATRLSAMHVDSGVDEASLGEIVVTGFDAAQANDLNARMLAGLRGIPGVESVDIINNVPFGPPAGMFGVTLDHKNYGTVVGAYIGEPGSVKAMGLKLVAGHLPATDDYQPLQGFLPPSARVLVTRALAERLWPGENPLGKEFWGGSNSFRVIGVLGHLTIPHPAVWGKRSPEWAMFIPAQPGGTLAGVYMIRAQPQDLNRVMTEARAKVAKIAPDVVLDYVNSRSIPALRDAFFKTDRSMTGLLVGVIVALLGVTALGIVGLASFWVAQRRKQIGIRRALGATRGDILRYFHTENFLIVTLGIVLGVVLAFAINYALIKWFEISPLPFWYLPVGAVVLWLLGQLAVLAPALRAANVPPVVATRSV